MTVTRCGLDIAEQVFHVHCIDDHGHILLRKTLSRSKVRGFFATLAPCIIGMETCARAHYWGRDHDLVHIPPLSCFALPETTVLKEPS
jgi:transposase